MRGRFVASPDSLSKHELLELLLFYAVPRVNVNPLAHRLLNKYGSLSAVLRAPVEDLKKEEGIGENTAVYLSAMGRLLDVCADEQIVSQKLYSFSAVKDHVLRYYRFYTDEVFTLFLLDAKNRIIGKELFTQNDASAVELPFADFVRSLVVEKSKIDRRRAQSSQRNMQTVFGGRFVDGENDVPVQTCRHHSLRPYHRHRR